MWDRFVLATSSWCLFGVSESCVALHRGEEVVESVHACNPLLRVRLSLLQPFCLYILGGGWGGGVRCISSALDV